VTLVNSSVGCCMRSRTNTRRKGSVASGFPPCDETARATGWWQGLDSRDEWTETTSPVIAMSLEPRLRPLACGFESSWCRVRCAAACFTGAWRLAWQGHVASRWEREEAAQITICASEARLRRG